MSSSVRRVVAGLLILLALNSSAEAGFDDSRAWFESLSQQDRFEVQINLVLVGTYDRLADGVFGPGTFRALVGFQAQRGDDNTGVLSGAQIDALRNAASRRYDELGFEEVKDNASGLGIFLPLKLLTGRDDLSKSFETLAEFAAGTTYASNDRGIELATVRVEKSTLSFADLYAALGTPTDARQTRA
jgi:hypothetical protein